MLINLGSIKDESYVAACRAELSSILDEAVRLRAEVMDITHSKL